MTYEQYILELLYSEPGIELSCQQITKSLLKYLREECDMPNYKGIYLSGSVSSKLAKLVKKGMLKYSEKVTARGGHIYTLAWSIEGVMARVKAAEAVVKYSTADMKNLVKFCHRIFSTTFQGGLPDKVVSDFLSSPEYKSE